MQNSRDKILVLILGILMSFGVLEVSLKVVGTVYLLRMRESASVKRNPGAFVILCIGDSFTKGVGASQGREYPLQLEELLKKKYPGEKIQVINKGVITFNTAEILEKFDENINEVNPDMVILLAGGANLWNVCGYRKHLNRDGWKERLYDFLYQVKTFKLIKLFLLDCRSKMDEAFNNKVFTLEKGKMSPEAVTWGAKGRKCQREGRYGEAVSCYKKQIEIDPYVDDGYNNLVGVYDLTRDREGRRQVAKKLVELHPDRNHLKSFAPRMRDEDIPFIKKYEHENPIVGDILKAREDQIKKKDKYDRELGLWITYDVEEMIRRAQRRGIAVILQNYPSYDGITPKSRYGFVNAALRKVAERNPVPFVDHERIFEEIFSKGERRADYFEPAKVHCNDRGYGIMAKNIYCGIIICNGVERLLAVDSAEKKQCLESENRAILPDGKQS